MHAYKIEIEYKIYSILNNTKVQNPRRVNELYIH